MILSPKLSVIVPVYNVENYLTQTLNSVIDQTIGFKENIQLILVNDGSPDDSGSICIDFQTRYPQNIIYIDQKNTGVSGARNKGLEKADGQYIHIMDSDDILSKNFYKESIDFLDSYESEIDIVSSKIQFFEASYKRHYLNDKYKVQRLIDLKAEPNNPLFHAPATVIRRSAIGNLSFDDRLKVTEDTKFLNQILHKKKKYGVLSRTTYYYRKHTTGTSAIAGKLSNRSYYLDTPRFALREMMDLWQTEDGKPEKYIQYLVMNDISWKLREEKSQSVLTKKEEDGYKDAIYSIIREIDDDVIINNKILNLNHKIFLLQKKYGKKYDKQLTFKSGVYGINGTNLFRPTAEIDNVALVFDFIYPLGGDRYKIEGHPQKGTVSMYDRRYIRTSKGDYPLNIVSRSQRRDGFLGDVFTNDEAFESIIELAESDTITGILKPLGESDEIKVPIYTKQFTGLGVLNNTYKLYGNKIFRRNGHHIQITSNTKSNRRISEIKFSLQILRNLQAKRVIGWQKESLKSASALWLFESKKRFLYEMFAPSILFFRSLYIGIVDVLVRQLYFRGLHKKSKPIWLISDRGTAAGDNGEALFRYIRKKENPEAEVYFVISKKSSDFNRLAKIGKVLDIDSFKYKMLALRADKIISSHADYYVYNPFGYRWTHLHDLYNFDFIFLQHGITKDDMSGWLNRFEKNIRLLITAAKPEYESFLQYDYYYRPENILLSGFPRFDRLENHPQGKLMLAPTWRHNLLEESRHHKSGIRQRSSTFKSTDYFKFYNNLMNDTRVINALKTTGMKGEFYLHPAFSVQSDDFTQNEHFTIKKMPYNYRNAFSESNILVTDYSSVVFDFAYLRKPVIYTQFDKESLYESHIYNEGYFSYEENGFGLVVDDFESAIEVICSTIQKPSLTQKFADRIDNFFEYTDHNNSRRVYDAIVAIGANRD